MAATQAAMKPAYGIHGQDGIRISTEATAAG
jgi:hypothetical protein